MPQNDFGLEVRPGSREQQTVIAPQGALVLEHIFKFQQAWREAQNGAVIFDLSKVNYLDSSAIGSLVNAQVAVSNRGKKMALAAVPERVRQMLAITRVDTLFTMFPDVEWAERALAGITATASS